MKKVFAELQQALAEAQSLSGAEGTMREAKHLRREGALNITQHTALRHAFSELRAAKGWK